MPGLMLFSETATSRSTHTSPEPFGRDAYADANNPERVALRGGRVLESIRGVAEDRSVKTFGEIVRSSNLSAEQHAKLMTIWKEARVEGRDFGKDIQALIPLIQQDPKLLDLLHKVAAPQADPATGKITLFNQELTSSNKAEFDKMRQEYLAELLRGSVSSHRVIQGPGSLCTAASMLKKIPSQELLRLGAEYAVYGKSTTAGGAVMEMQQRFVDRAKSSSTGTLDSIKSGRPSQGMLMLLDGVMELGVDNVKSKEGAYWFEYTDAWRNLSGKECACAGRDARILYNPETKRAVSEAGQGVQELSQVDYLFTVAAEANGERAKGVLIDTKWNHAQAGQPTESMHGRHMLKAVGVTKDEHGNEYLVCENPIGDFIDLKTRSTSRAEYVKEGTILGDPDSFWCKTGSRGIVYIRKDVVEANLQTLLVEYDESYHVSSGKPVRSIGTMSSEAGVYEHPIPFVQTDDPARSDVSQTEKTKVEYSQGLLRSVDDASQTHLAPSRREVADDAYTGSLKFGRKLEDEKHRLVEDEPVVSQKKPSPDQSSVGLAFGYGSDPAGSIRAPEAPIKPAEKEAKPEAPQPQGSSLISKTLFG
jgi:hypothetical protein